MSGKSKKTTILLTSAIEDAELFLEQADGEDVEILHLPLEKYVAVEQSEEELTELIDQAENIIYGHKRSAQFFLDQIREHDLLDTLTDRVNLASDQRAADLLEARGVPAIYPGSDEPIKMLEFLMRLRRLGTVLYPCGKETKEEIPGLLTELDIEVNEYVLFELEGPTQEELKTYRQQIEETAIDAIIYHSRRAVNRIQAAFPEITESGTAIIAGDKAVAEKLQGHKLEADEIAGGSWESILEQVKELG